MILRIATVMVEELSLRCRPGGSSRLHCDNNSVVINSSVPEPLLNKRHSSICYHRVRESQSSITLRVGWIPGEYNIVYLLTKTTMKVNMRHGVVELIFYNKSVVIREKYER